METRASEGYGGELLRGPSEPKSRCQPPLLKSMDPAQHQCFGWQGSGNSKFDPEDMKKRLPAVEKMTLEARKIVEGRARPPSTRPSTVDCAIA
jgi:hypothetical protein